LEVDLVGRDHEGMVGESDVECGGSRTFIGIGSIDGEEVAGGAGV
jgi:hypothetical protein